MSSLSPNVENSKRKHLRRIVLPTVVLFYLGWFGSIYAAQQKMAVVSLLFPIALIAFQFFSKQLETKRVSWAIAGSLIGILFDGMMLQFGLVTVSNPSFGFLPIWLISIWLLFTFSMITLSEGFRLPVWALAILGGIFGPLSYKSGEIFEVMSFSNSFAVGIYAGFWMVMFPWIIRVARPARLQ